FFDWVSSVGVARPVKVENTCLLKAPVKIVSGLPPAVHAALSTVLSRASVNTVCVPSVRVPVPSAAAGSAPPAPFAVLVLIQDRIEAGLRAVGGAPATVA